MINSDKDNFMQCLDLINVYKNGGYNIIFHSSRNVELWN